MGVPRKHKIIVLVCLLLLLRVIMEVMVIQWGSENRPFKIRKNSKSLHFEGWISNDATIRKQDKIV